MLNRTLFFVACIFLVVPLSVAGEQNVAIDGELQQWHRVTLTFSGPDSSEDAKFNPFRDYRMSVAFVHEKTGKRYVVPGFFAADGDAAESSATAGDKWRVRFTPEETGTWKYVDSVRTGKDIAIAGQDDAGKPSGGESVIIKSIVIGPGDVGRISHAPFGSCSVPI